MASILVIDDDAQVCGVVKDYLEAAGHTVTEASKLDDIYDRLHHTSPDVVLLDVRMPEINGLELLPQVKAYLPTARVVIITAVDDYRVEDLFYEFGADDYVLKPFRGDDIRHAVDKSLKESHEDKVA